VLVLPIELGLLTTMILCSSSSYHCRMHCCSGTRLLLDSTCGTRNIVLSQYCAIVGLRLPNLVNILNYTPNSWLHRASLRSSKKLANCSGPFPKTFSKDYLSGKTSVLLIASMTSVGSLRLLMRLSSVMNYSLILSERSSNFMLRLPSTDSYMVRFGQS
jgi:hypothetical protein